MGQYSSLGKNIKMYYRVCVCFVKDFVHSGWTKAHDKKATTNPAVAAAALHEHSRFMHTDTVLCMTSPPPPLPGRESESTHTRIIHGPKDEQIWGVTTTKSSNQISTRVLTSSHPDTTNILILP